ncbi:MAG TPA: tetratricopeptide repeat protein [Anaeromyxobacteraceae bacterium]
MHLLRATPAMLVATLAACGGELEAASPRRAESAPLLAALADPAGPATGDLRSGRLPAARARLEASLASDPDTIAALNDLAVSYSMEERFDAARQLLDEVLTRGGAREQQAALVNLGELYAVDGYLTAAHAHLASAKAIDASRPEPAYALALLADARGDRAGAAAALREALESDRSGAARRELAFLYPEERLHLDALVADAMGDATTADARWRELARGRFQALAQAAQRHLEEP